MKLRTPYNESDVYRTSSSHIEVVCDAHPYNYCGEALRTGLHADGAVTRPVYSVTLHGEALPDLHVLRGDALYPLVSRNGRKVIDAPSAAPEKGTRTEQ